MENTSSSSGGIGFAGLLTIVFIVLKLCGVIAWSWIWVLGPLWIPVAITLAILAAFVAVYAFVLIAAAVVLIVAAIFDK